MEKTQTQILVAVLVGAALAAALIFWVIPAKGGDQLLPDPEKVYCKEGWCMVHQDKLVFLTRTAANQLCGWEK